jgi:hypothetical protein
VWDGAILVVLVGGGGGHAQVGAMRVPKIFVQYLKILILCSKRMLEDLQ